MTSDSILSKKVRKRENGGARWRIITWCALLLRASSESMNTVKFLLQETHMEIEGNRNIKRKQEKKNNYICFF